jgi:hypothetical protein
MQVKVVPVNGCANVFLSLVTLGVYPLMAWLNLRGWPQAVDEQGLVTRAGTKIAWNEFTKITKVITRIGRTSATTTHYELQSPKGKVVVAPYRLKDGDKVFDYVWQHLPEQAKKA